MSPDRHLEQAQRNLTFARELIETRPNDVTWLQWAVTSAFYCAVHCIEAHLSQFGVRSTSHRGREAYMADPQYQVPPEVDAAYQPLRQLSEASRYHGHQFDVATVKETVLDTHLDKVLRFVHLA